MALFNRNPLDWDSLSKPLRTLILVNLGVFILQSIAGRPIWEYFALVPARVTQDFWLWQLATYMFLHGSLLHLFFNMLMVWMFGSVLESQWGTRELMKFFFICGIGAGLTSVLLGWDSFTPTIGASGAVFGFLVAFGMVFPDAVVYVWFFIPMKARTMAIVFGLLELMMTMSHSRSNVAGFAHVGGMLTGYVYLRFGGDLALRLGYWSRVVTGGLRRPSTGGGGRKKVRAAVAAPPPDELETEVNRILDKVLDKGEASLTTEEREVMRRYAKRNKP